MSELNIIFTRPTLQAADPECEACGGERHVLGSEGAARCACWESARAARRFTASAVPASLYHPATGAVPEPELTAALERVQREAAKRLIAGACDLAASMAAGQPPPLDMLTAGVVVGVAGSGKSWLLVRGLRRALLMGVRAVYLPGADPFAALKAIGGGSLEIGRERLADVPLLLLDDLGSHRNEASSLLVRDLLVERIAKASVTVCATRSAHAALASEFGDGVADALRANAVSLSNGSLRGA